MHTSLFDARVNSAIPAAHTSRSQHAVKRSHVVRCDQNQQIQRQVDVSRSGQQCVRLCAGALALQQSACVGPAYASEAVSGVSEATGTLPLALGGGAAIAALSAALIATDPQKR